MKYKFILLFIIALHVFLLAKLIFFPYPEIFVYPFLANNGLLPYKQIFDQHFPSLLTMPVNLYTLGLRSPESARVFLMVSVVINQIFIYLISKKFFKNHWLILLPNFIYLLMQPLFEGNILWLDSFLTPIILIGFYFTLVFIEKERKADAFLAGFFMGLAIFIKQAILPLAAVLALYLIFKKKSLKILWPFIIGVVIPPAVLFIWIINRGLVNDFFYWTVVFNFEVYAKMGRKFPTLSQLGRLLVYFLPAFYFVALGIKKNTKMVLLAIFLILSPLLALSRFEFVHLQPTLPFLALALTGFFSSVKGNVIKITAVCLYFTLTLVWLTVFYKGHLGNFVYFFDSKTLETASKVANLTKVGEHIFVFGTQPVIYPLANRLPAGKVFTITVPWNMKAAEARILSGLEEDRPSLVVRDSSATIDEKKVVDFSQKINSFIDQNYIKIDQVGENEILIPKK